MALNLRKAVIRNVAVNMTICFVLSIGLGLLSDAIDLDGINLAWPLILAIGIGLFSGWQTTAKIKSGVLKSIAQPISYMRLAREPHARNNKPDWETLDDYAAQVRTRGFSKLGEYTPYPPPKQFACAAACFIDASESIIIEVQHMRPLMPSASETRHHLNGVHFSIASIVGGKIRVVTTDHNATATNFLIRGDHDVVACYPGMSMLALLGKHEQLLGSLRQRTGKSPTTGLTMERYILMQREGFRQARERLQKKSGYEIAKQIDEFEENPLKKWAPPSIRLAALPEGTLEYLDTGSSADGQPAVMDAPAPALAASLLSAAADRNSNEMQEDHTSDVAAYGAQADALRERAASGANWFYWIAGLSLVNIVTGTLGSDWGFAIGLGISQVLSGIANELRGAGTSFGTVGLLYSASLAVAAFFAACGWFSRRPSIITYAVGMTVFAADSLIFLLAADWIGVAFHVLALFFLWSGFSAARQLRKYATD